MPADIAQNETLPSVMRDPAFLQPDEHGGRGRIGQPRSTPRTHRSRQSASNYRFRQRPGTSNSLGLVKFMFPNQFNVYLHDTPADSLFARASRSFSHGCVRLEQPEKLADTCCAISRSGRRERISEAMHAGEERRRSS